MAQDDGGGEREGMILPQQTPYLCDRTVGFYPEMGIFANKIPTTATCKIKLQTTSSVL